MPASSSPPPEENFPLQGRLLALDYGTKRLGLALSDPTQSFASPLENYTRRSPALDARYLLEIQADYKPVGLIVGLPVHMSGDEGEKAQLARTFGDWAAALLKLPIRYWDERYTSSLATEYLRSANIHPKKHQAYRDKLAA